MGRGSSSMLLENNTKQYLRKRVGSFLEKEKKAGSDSDSWSLF